MTEYYVARKIVLAWPQEKDGQPGYAVKYRNGHISWCPKEDFEKDNRVLGHDLGLYTYEQQLIMAELAEFEDKREALYALEEAGDELASIERKTITLYIDILHRKIAKFAKVEEVKEVAEPLAVAGDGSKTYIPFLIDHVSDFNFFRAAASMVDQIKEIGHISLSKIVNADGVSLEIFNESTVDSGDRMEFSGSAVGAGIFNISINLKDGEVTAATRGDGMGGAWKGVTFGWDIEWVGPNEVQHQPV